MEGYVEGIGAPDCIIIPTHTARGARLAFLDGVADGQRLARQLVPMPGMRPAPRL